MYHTYSWNSGEDVKDYIKCELIVGGSLRHTFSILFIVAVYYTHNSCYVLLLLLTEYTHVHHVVDTK